MKDCLSCGEHTFMHMHGAMRCLHCDFTIDSVRRKSRTKRVIDRIDRIGARLANVRW